MNNDKIKVNKELLDLKGIIVYYALDKSISVKLIDDITIGELIDMPEDTSKFLLDVIKTRKKSKKPKKEIKVEFIKNIVKVHLNNINVIPKNINNMILELEDDIHLLKSFKVYKKSIKFDFYYEIEEKLKSNLIRILKDNLY